jgi:hypothetical protein
VLVTLRSTPVVAPFIECSDVRASPEVRVAESLEVGRLGTLLDGVVATVEFASVFNGALVSGNTSLSPVGRFTGLAFGAAALVGELPFVELTIAFENGALVSG